MKTHATENKRTVRFLLLLVLLAAVLMCACQEEKKTSKGKSREAADDVTPTSVQPTAEPTAEPTVEPTNEPTPEPTRIPVQNPTETDIPAECYGMWYAHSFEGLEASSVCKDDPSRDERMLIYEKGLCLTLTFDRLEEVGETDYFVLRTDFSEKEREFYREMGYGMETYLDNPTDASKGHFIYSCTNATHYGALFIVNLMSDGSLSTEYAYVDDNGTFPVMTEGVYKREPVFPMGTYYEDYLGIWYCKSFANYYEDAFTASDEEPIDYRLWICDDGTLRIIDTWGDERENYDIYNYTLCPYFTNEELSDYRRWDEDGIKVWGEFEQGLAESIAKQGTSLVDGHMIFLCYDYGYEGEFVSVSFWPEKENGQDVLCMDWIGYDADERQEYAMYLTFTRENPYSYTKGTCYSDYIGTWQMRAYMEEGDDELTYLKDPFNYPELRIDNDDYAEETLPDGTLTMYRLRLDTKVMDPDWLIDYGISKEVTDFANGHVVFTTENLTATEGTVLILDYQRDGTIVAKSYVMKNGTVTEYPHILYVRQGGQKR